MKDNRVLQNEAEKDPETLEREIDQTRAAMNETLDSLERKLTPGQLLDECLRFVGKSGGEIGRSLGDSIKNNPMPVLLTATGIAWMIFSPGRRSAPPSYDYIGDADYGDVSYVSEQGTVSKMTEKIRSGATSARSQLSSSKDVAKDALNKTTDAVRDTAHRTTDTVRETFNRTTNVAQAQARRAREGFNSVLEEQPLILGALGIALGAAIGAALPSTEQEDRLMGEARDKTVNKVKESGAQAVERARDTVKKTADDIQQAMAEQDNPGPAGVS